MTIGKKDAPTKNSLIKNWRGRATKRREDDAWRAGVATADGSNEPQYEKDKKRYTDIRSSGRYSMRPSQIRTSDEKVVLQYHAPVPKVQFQCFIQKSRKSNTAAKATNKSSLIWGNQGANIDVFSG